MFGTTVLMDTKHSETSRAAALGRLRFDLRFDPQLVLRVGFPRRARTLSVRDGQAGVALSDANRRAGVAVHNLTKSFGATRALDNLTFTVEEGRFFVLFGPSSVGKTTTLRTIAGLIIPDAGRLMLGGVDMTRAPINSRGVSMVFQSFALYPISPSMTISPIPCASRRRHRPRSASGSRKPPRCSSCRIASTASPIPCRAASSSGSLSDVPLIRHPRILLLDEPLTNLDAKLRHDMRAELKRLHRQFGMTIIYATPDELEALSMGEEIAVMRSGSVVQQGTPDTLYENPADLYVASKIGSPHMNLIEAKVETGATPWKQVSLPSRCRRSNRRSMPASRSSSASGRPTSISPGWKRQRQGAVQLLEPLGDVTVVSFAPNGQSLRVVLPESRASRIKLGDELKVHIEPERIHVFRAHDGIALR